MFKLKPINKRPTSLPMDRFYAMNQAVITKSSTKVIYLGGRLIVGGILASIGINDNNIISEIPNWIPSTSILWCAANKSREAKFVITAGFVCNYLCSISCKKGDHYRIVSLFKEIAFWGGEVVQLIRLDEYASKGYQKNYQSHLTCH